MTSCPRRRRYRLAGCGTAPASAGMRGCEACSSSDAVGHDESAERHRVVAEDVGAHLGEVAGCRVGDLGLSAAPR